MSVTDDTRRQLADLARRPRRRSAVFHPESPVDWRPHQVRNPDAELDPPHDVFTEAGAWEFIARKLDDGHDVRVVTLRVPAGARAYVMTIDLETSKPPLYVKLQLRHGRILGRSFHYSEH
ncbi:MAG: hypothetical protein OXG44_22060 [Gammaproteobacteria bacterium]|nr:hypothetical protein [Gammaproteobacteria bacterium]